VQVGAPLEEQVVLQVEAPLEGQVALQWPGWVPLWNQTGQWDPGRHDAAGQLGVAGSPIDWVSVGTGVAAPLEEQVVHLGGGSATASLEEQGALAAPL